MLSTDLIIVVFQTAGKFSVQTFRIQPPAELLYFISLFSSPFLLVYRHRGRCSPVEAQIATVTPLTHPAPVSRKPEG